MTQKSKKGTTIIIVVLCIALLGSIGYIVYDKVLKKEPVVKEEKEKEKKEEKEDTTREVAENEKTVLLNQITAYTSSFGDIYPVTETSSMPNQTALQFALATGNLKGQEVMESDLETVLKKYFGATHSFHHEDIQCFLGDGPLYKYDSATRKYTFQNTHGHGGGGTMPSTNYYLSGTVTNEKTYEVKVNIIYSDYCGDTCGPSTGYYKTAMKNHNRTDYILGPYTDIHELIEQDYQSVKDQLPITTFTFEKDELGNYGLKSVTVS